MQSDFLVELEIMDRNPKLLYMSFLSFVVLGLLHHLGITFYFYWIYWWFDIVMHFLGGLSGGLITYWALFHSGLFSKIGFTHFTSIVLILVCVMVVGVVWEIFEYIYDLRIPHENYTIDTTIDLIMDALGAFLAGVIGVRGKSRGHG